MDTMLMHLLALLCFYGPTPIAGFLSARQAMQCKAPRQAFVVALVGTIVLAVVMGVAVDQLPVWGVGFTVWHMWLLHLLASPVLAVPLASYCAYRVQQRAGPPTDSMG
jgi:hypothetical protein